MFTIYLRCYPQADIDFCELEEIPLFSNLRSAKKAAANLTAFYASEEWYGHYLYKSRFYADAANYQKGGVAC